ncbi:hypothetical protein [Micromonospora sp. RTP1Z1]|uniref:hypothetical protein n=1 Tax=Micromonospora sp. RTP1Z1 TaxID=2994043 RepID=UPI0029C916B6|nr:hypothetical protein [Micromonospora sp. RTP1Z1]
MTTILVVLAVLAVLVGGAYGAVAWRDRRPTSDDPAAAREARARQHRYEAERHGSQGDTWQRGQRDPNS